MRGAGYTRSVGRWQVRAVGVLLMTVLAGAPAIAAACAAACSGGAPETAASAGAASGHEHHHATAAHGRPLHAAAAPTPDGQPDARLTGWSARACCDTLGQPRASLTASRADTDLLATPPAAVLPPGAVYARLRLQPAGPSHAPPPGRLAPARAPLVLRI